MPYRTRQEKKALKRLRDFIKTRKINGARIAQGQKTAEELRKLQMAPSVYVFKNLFSGQVMYSQVPAYHQDQIDKQFIQPNWQNRKPSRRNDLWRIMCVAEFDNYEYAVAAYEALVQLKNLRDSTEGQREIRKYRPKNEEGNIWSSGQFRPIYSQEAVADIAHVIDEFQLENTRLFWENAWRKGEDKYWNEMHVQHQVLPPHSPKHERIVLDELRQKAIEEFARARQAANVTESELQSQQTAAA